VALSQAATAAASGDPDTILDADDEPRPVEPEPAAPQAEAKPRPADGRIDEASSLFDL
jgi:hypothetical protein